MWWLPSPEEVTRLGTSNKAALDATEDEWGSELLQLAAKQRMNTDVRRAVFCIIMGSEDYADASERLLRLSLKVHRFSMQQQDLHAGHVSINADQFCRERPAERS